MIVTGARNTYADFGKQVATDFTGDGAQAGFVWWIVALGAVGAVGYIKELQTLSRTFLALIMVSFILKNGSVFQELDAAIKAGPTQAKPASDSLTSGGSTQSAVLSSETSAANSDVNAVTNAISAGAARAGASNAAQQNFHTATTLFESIAPFFGL